MANNIIEIHKDANAQKVSPGQIVTLGEGTNFDTVTERWYFGSGLPQGYQAGGVLKPVPVQGAVNPSWVCMGPSDVEELPSATATAPVIATITWRGLFKTGSDNTTVTETWTTRETAYTSISGIPGSGGAVKGRLIDIIPGFSMRGIYPSKQTKPIITHGQGAIQAPQGITAPNPGNQIDVANVAATWCYPWGWIPASWQQEEVLPGIFFVSAEYRYEYQKVFG